MTKDVQRFLSIFPQDDMINFAEYVWQQSQIEEHGKALAEFGRVEVSNMLCEWCAKNRKYRLV